MTNAKKKIYVIINPKSGTSSKQNMPHKIASSLNPKKFEVHIFITGYAGHGSEIARLAIDDKVDYVIAVGGDGTVNEVARTLVGSNTTLGIIPSGSGNGLARDLQIPVSVNEALDIINEENIVEIDYGIVNGSIFFCTCGMGFDALVSQRAAKEKKRGSLMYLKNILEAFVEQTPENYEIICPEGTIKDKAFVVNCANTSQYGYNAYIAPHANVQDGLMNISIIKPLNILDVPQTTLQLFTKNIDTNKNLTQLLTKEVIIKREKEGVIHIDGDPVYTGKEIKVNIVPKGLKVLVPTKPVKKKLDPLDVLTNITRWI